MSESLFPDCPDPLLAALIAERNAGDWYARRVAEHHDRLHAQGQGRAHTAADARRTRWADQHARRTRWGGERHAQVTAAADAGDTLDQAAAALWVTPEGLRSWLERHDRGLLDRLRANERQGAA